MTTKKKAPAKGIPGRFGPRSGGSIRRYTLDSPTAVTGTSMEKPAAAPSGVTLIVRMVLDASGSMEIVRDPTIESINEYIAQVERDRAGAEILFSLTIFNSEHTHTRDEKPIGEQKPITREEYAPGGWTPLYDAIGHSIGEVKTALAKREKAGLPAARVVMVIVTDGEENSSREFSRAQIGELIKDLEESGDWAFAYLGANQDSWRATAGMNVNSARVANYSAADPRPAMRATAHATMTMSAAPAGQSLQSYGMYTTDAAGFVVDPANATAVSDTTTTSVKKSVKPKGAKGAGDPNVKIT